MRFICKNCNYRFESEIEQRERKCPYCGKITLVEELTAEDLVKDVE